MGKIGVAAIKYVIKAKLQATGVVERPDVIGAIFGQTEGLLGDELELRELQRSGKIGRIEVNVTSKDGKSEGVIEVPTSLNKEDTALLAAALEIIDRIGPCDSKITIQAIEDVRSSKRDYVVDRAKKLLNEMEKGVPESQELSNKVKEKIRTTLLTTYGTDRLPAGPDVETAENIILVEGRADVINLLKSGVLNAVGIGGITIPETIIELCKQKTVTAFLDGDRGGDLILKALLQVMDINFVARAPIGREVEELTQKEILKALRNKLPPKEAQTKKVAEVKKPAPSTGKKARSFSQSTTTLKPELKLLSDATKKMQGSRKACLLTKSGTGFKEIGRVSRSDLDNVLKNLEKGKAQALIVDWEITQSLVNEAASKDIKYLFGSKKPRTLKRKPGMVVFGIGTTSFERR